MNASTPPPIKWAPREIFEKILEFAVIPTFDLVLDVPGSGVILVKRTIPPYQNLWALPGLRMCKPEEIEDTLIRIARQEVGLDIDPQRRHFLGQYVGKFEEEFERQDISTGFALTVQDNQIPVFNPQHFDALCYVNCCDDIPPNTGAMYEFYLNEYFSHRQV